MLYSAFYFAEFGLIWRDLDFLQNNHFFPKNDFFEKMSIMCPIDDLKVGYDWMTDQE